MSSKSKKFRTSNNYIIEKNFKTEKNLSDSFFKWKFKEGITDFEHDYFGWHLVEQREILNIVISKLQDYEKLEWRDIFKQKSCHHVTFEYLEEKNNKIYNYLINKFKPEDLPSEFYQIAIDHQKRRIFGYRDGNTFYIILYDQFHLITPRDL